MKNKEHREVGQLSVHKQRVMSIWLDKSTFDLMDTAAIIMNKIGLIAKPSRHGVAKYSVEKVVTEIVRRYSEELDRQGDGQSKYPEDSEDSEGNSVVRASESEGEPGDEAEDSDEGFEEEAYDEEPDKYEGR